MVPMAGRSSMAVAMMALSLSAKSRESPKTVRTWVSSQKSTSFPKVASKTSEAALTKGAASPRDMIETRALTVPTTACRLRYSWTSLRRRSILRLTWRVKSSTLSTRSSTVAMRLPRSLSVLVTWTKRGSAKVAAVPSLILKPPTSSGLSRPSAPALSMMAQMPLACVSSTTHDLMAVSRASATHGEASSGVNSRFRTARRMAEYKIFASKRLVTRLLRSTRTSLSSSGTVSPLSSSSRRAMKAEKGMGTVRASVVAATTRQSSSGVSARPVTRLAARYTRACTLSVGSQSRTVPSMDPDTKYTLEKHKATTMSSEAYAARRSYWYEVVRCSSQATTPLQPPLATSASSRTATA
mmetsp:Transcript_7490/g.23112  ORF Transcript_7490/g.23112 Transcript_7490/m.23112 type:complete len:354 (-) Transcript_7490:376-1437(-)